MRMPLGRTTHMTGKVLSSVWKNLFLFFGPLIVILCLLLVSTRNGNGEEDLSSLPSKLSAHRLLLDATRAGDRICAVGERGHVLISLDNGKNWRQVKVPTRATLTGVTFQGPDTGWIVGHDSIILKTMTGGEQWETVYNAPSDDCPLFDVWFQNKDRGFAIGAYGLCLKTLDGGSTWHRIRVSSEEWHLNHMACSEDGRLYIAAEAGRIYRSDDNGNSWITLPSPYGGSFFGVIPLEKDGVVVFGLRGHVFRSDNAGENWTPLPTGTLATLAAGVRLSRGRIILAGLGGTVLVGRLEDKTFRKVPGMGRRGFWALVKNNDDELICFGEDGATPVPVPETIPMVSNFPIADVPRKISEKTGVDQ